ncbi:hypothetical protein DERP_008082 [Dermatophagoides pteronyssinus]|uniref:Transmembrane protein n=1 Tax=Dermatophagoides pteronyssinus TaxID=6956 RepID=A0ABQ8JJS5_DERPT|nr:hypothetical protein DERP_008082 [Dermatophagoides pteronyssinus]
MDQQKNYRYMDEDISFSVSTMDVSFFVLFCFHLFISLNFFYFIIQFVQIGFEIPNAIRTTTTSITLKKFNEKLKIGTKYD